MSLSVLQRFLSSRMSCLGFWSCELWDQEQGSWLVIKCRPPEWICIYYKFMRLQNMIYSTFHFILLYVVYEHHTANLIKTMYCLALFSSSADRHTKQKQSWRGREGCASKNRWNMLNLLELLCEIGRFAQLWFALIYFYSQTWRWWLQPPSISSSAASIFTSSSAVGCLFVLNLVCDLPEICFRLLPNQLLN